jgi:divalent metal cation (Fe/Co/Zn/Cd) transporter
VNNPARQIDTDRYFQYALWLGYFTIAFNVLEGVISLGFGISDEALTLFGFGIDSFIEVLSGIGIVVMILRIRSNPDTSRSIFEKNALRLTGFSFYLLSVGLLITAILNIFSGHKPENTLAGVVISLVSIASMWTLVSAKRKVGRALNSDPILADANCTLVCIYMSLVLLASSFLYMLTGFGFMDSLGSIGLIYFSIKEGREAFEKARGIDSCDCSEERT